MKREEFIDDVTGGGQWAEHYDEDIDGLLKKYGQHDPSETPQPRQMVIAQYGGGWWIVGRFRDRIGCQPTVEAGLDDIPWKNVIRWWPLDVLVGVTPVFSLKLKAAALLIAFAETIDSISCADCHAEGECNNTDEDCISYKIQRAAEIVKERVSVPSLDKRVIGILQELDSHF